MNSQHQLRVVACVIVLAAAVRPLRAQTSPPAARTSKRDSIPLTSILLVDALAFGGSAVVIDSAEIASSHARQLSEFLTARAPGLSVLRSGGVEAEGARVALRGPTSLSFPTYPLLIVDGMRVDATQEAATIDFDVHPSRLDDIALGDIDRIVILPGAVSASFFGPGAVNGVIAITTKRARGEPWGWRSAIETRFTSVPDRFPPNYHQTGLTPAGQPAPFCDRVTVSQGNCIPTGLTQWNPLEQASPFRLGRAVHARGEASGAARLMSAYAGVTGDRDLGVTDDDDAGKLTGRVNVDEQPLHSLRFAEHVGYQRTSAGFPRRGNVLDRSNVIGNGLLGSATDDTLRGYRIIPNTPTSVGRQRATHWQLGMNGGWRARSWLELLGSIGYDQVAQHDVGNLFLPSQLTLVTINGTFNHDLHTSELVARATYALHADVDASSAMGFTRWTSATYAQYASPTNIVTQSNFWRATGPFISQRLTWRDRVSLGASARSEQLTESFFGALPRQLFKTLDASWTVPPLTASTEFRLRAAYGEGSQAPRSDPEVVARFVTGLINPITASDKVERTIEREVGADFRFGRLVSLGLALYSDNSGNLAFNAPVGPPPIGTSGPLYSYGSMRTSGVNASGAFALVDRGPFRWDLTAGLSTIRNRVISLGSSPPFIFTASRIQSGVALSSYFDIPYRYADANHNGLIEPAEVQASATPVYVGSGLPTREAFLRNQLAITRNLTMRATFDYRGGQYLWNRNEDTRCAGVLNCRGANDPAAPLAEQAAFVAERLDFTHHIEKAAFTKLRELSLEWRVPALKSSAGRDVTLSIAGMNLWTWTRYKGVDPEVTTGWFDDEARIDLAKSPIPRTLVIRLDVR